MKLSLILSFVCVLQVSAFTFGQKVTLSRKNVKLVTVFKEIQKVSGYNIFYDKSVIPENAVVNIEVMNRDIDDVLDEILKNYNLESKRVNRDIVIRKVQDGSVLLRRVQYLQENVISGYVLNSDSIPLEGVTILEKGTQNKTLTNAEGKYTIKLEHAKAVLQFKFLGYNEREVIVADQQSINLILTEQVRIIDEIVVVAYGTQKKETVTGAIASVQTKEIKQSPSANLAITLAGRLPGLTAMQVTGAPGSDRVDLFLRGVGTTNSSAPLIMVDGVERDINYIDPNEVNSVSILKDASSTALFGVRGANGVILVTTKRGGSTQKPEINFTGEYGIQRLARVPNKVDAYNYAVLRNEAAINDGLAPIYSGKVLEHYRLKDLPDIYQDNDWYKLLMKDFTPINRYNLNVSGGGNRMSYFVNAGYLYQGGQWNINQYVDNPQTNYDPSSYLKRYNFRSNIDFNINNTLKSFLNVAGYLENTNGPSGGTGNWWIFDRINALPALTPGPVTPEGDVVATPEDGDVPYGLINRAGYQQGTNSNVTASFGFEQDLKFITKGLSAKAMMSFDTKSQYNLSGSRTYYKVVQVIGKTVDGRDTAYYIPRGDGQVNSNLNLNTNSSFQSYTNFQFNLNYARTFDKHALTGLVLAQQDKRILPGDPLPYYLIGLSSRLTYAYDNKYFFEFNGGYNGSEQFAQGRRFGFFPAISGGWLLSQEEFLRNSDIITNLKLRASYGLVGSDRFGGQRFLYLDNIQVNGGGYSPSLGLGQVVNENFIGNQLLKWEVAKVLNIGAEIGFLNHFNVSVDVFKQNRNNVLISRQNVPGLNGFSGSLAPANIGKITNRGFEVEMNYNQNFSNDWRVISKLSLSYAKNKIVDFGENPFSEDYAFRYRQTGYSIGQPFGYVVDGFFNSAQDIADYARYNIQNPRPGDFKYKDTNGDHIIDERDMVPVGHPSVPEYTFGFAFNVGYKGLDLSLLLQGNLNVSQNFTMPSSFLYSFMENAWTREKYSNGDEISYPALSMSTSVSNNYPNSFFITNTSYLRLKNAEIGYTLSSRIASKIGANKVRFYCNGLNLLTFDKMFMKDFDPEQAGLDAYPIYKVVNFGLNVIF